jgi:hypothetical protein
MSALPADDEAERLRRLKRLAASISRTAELPEGLLASLRLDGAPAVDAAPAPSGRDADLLSVFRNAASSGTRGPHTQTNAAGTRFSPLPTAPPPPEDDAVFPPPDSGGYTLLYGILCFTDPTVSLLGSDGVAKRLAAFRDKVRASVLTDLRGAAQRYREVGARRPEPLSDIVDRLAAGLHPAKEGTSSDALSDAGCDPAVVVHLSDVVGAAIVTRPKGCAAAQLHPRTATAEERALLFTWDDGVPGYVRRVPRDGGKTLAAVRSELQRELAHRAPPPAATLAQLCDIASSLAVEVPGRATKAALREGIELVVAPRGPAAVGGRAGACQ